MKENKEQIENIEKVDNLLNKIAASMGAKVVTWDDVNDAIERNISFGMLISIDNYCSEQDKAKIKQKSFIG